MYLCCALQQSKQVQREVTITAFHEEQNKSFKRAHQKLEM